MTKVIPQSPDGSIDGFGR